ncbi:MAG: flagellar biosynthesis protein FlhB [Solirubrobacteraceae bacterium]|jgi:flagellar biosynthetic protein FlhB|nr:flagellar biosynthesis protein FlhB [Solirubrobacteraceae bacterium]
MAGGDKTEKATPKRRAEARKKGQVAKSQDLGGAVVLLAALFSLSALGPMAWGHMRDAMLRCLSLIATPDVIDHGGIGKVLLNTLTDAGLGAGPIALVCMLTGVLTGVLQVGWKPSAGALKPDPKRINPIKGAKNLFGVHFLFESVKTVVKFAVVGAIAAMALFGQLDELGALVGMTPAELLSRASETILQIAQRGAMAYLVIALVDFAWQRYRFEKQMKMDKEEVKQEFKQQTVSAEVRGAMRRRQMQAARARMMADVPGADVVVTNPTHFAVALRYGNDAPAPVVVAKGQDLIAARIRAIAAEHDVPVISNPPLARALHASVEINSEIPEEMFGAVAQLLAFVYRTAGRRAEAAAG